jgi:hypothetical protein
MEKGKKKSPCKVPVLGGFHEDIKQGTGWHARQGKYSRVSLWPPYHLIPAHA